MLEVQCDIILIYVKIIVFVSEEMIILVMSLQWAETELSHVYTSFCSYALLDKLLFNLIQALEGLTCMNTIKVFTTTADRQSILVCCYCCCQFFVYS